MAYDNIKTALKNAGHTISADFDKKMSDPKFAEQVRGALAVEGHMVPDSAQFFQKYGRGSMPSARDTLEQMRRESIAKQDVTQAPMKKGKSGPSLPGQAYEWVRQKLAYAPALLPAAFAAVSGEGSHQEDKSGKATPTPGAKTAGGRFKRSLKENAEAYGRGEGFGGMVADPLNLIPMLGVEGKLARLAGTALEGTPLAAKLARAASATGGLLEKYPAAYDIGKAGLQGAGLGAGYSAASYALDPEKDSWAPSDALYAAGIGGALGAGGRLLQSNAKGRFPGIDINIDNRKVANAAKENVARNLDMILGQGLLPSGKGRLLSQSAERRGIAGEKYSQALQDLNEAHPEATIDLSKVRSDAEGIVRGDYAALGTPKFEYAPETVEGYRLPSDVTDQLNARIGNLKGTKLARLETELGMPVTDYAKSLWGTNGDGVNLYNLYMNTRFPGMRQAITMAANLRAIARDAGSASSLGSVARTLSKHGNELTPAFMRTLMATTPEESQAAAAAVNDIASNFLTPTEFASDRRRLVDPKTWTNPAAGTPSETAQDVGLALHEAGVNQLKSYPEYASSLGDADKQYKLEKDLQNVIRYPGPMGLSHRVSLPLWNGAVDPWLLSSGEYKLGGLARRAGITPLAGDALQDLVQSYAQRKNAPQATSVTRDTTATDSAR